MSNIAERVGIVIDDSGLTRVKFAKAINVGPSAITMICNGTNTPSEQTKELICTKFRIRREWLETGEGPMKYPEPSEDASDINQLLDGEPDEVVQIVRAFLKTAKKLNPERREQLNAFMRELKENWQ